MNEIQERQEEIIEEFSMFDDWMDRYEYIIELGKTLPLIDPKFKDGDHLIRGCQSQVWLHAEAKPDRTLEFTADSDAVITRGLIALIVRVLNGQAAADIATAELDFINEIGLHEHLSPTRSNGLRSMVQQMKLHGVKLS